MPRDKTPIPGPHDPATPRTPGANTNNTTAMHVQRNTPVPSTPGGHHRRISSIPRTPGTSARTCSSSPSVFTHVTVHTAKCSECDKRNKGTMLRCPGCTFQVCKPCQEKREKGGKSLAHGNMLSPQVATPGMSGSVVRRRPVGTVRSVEKEKKNKEQEERKGGVWKGDVVEEKSEIEEMKARKRMVKPAPKPKAKAKSRAREVTPSDDSSDDDFGTDPASPTANKRRRTGNAPKLDATHDIFSPFLRSTENPQAPEKPDLGDSKFSERPLSDMTTDEILVHYDVNTPMNPYKSHLLSRHEPVVTNPVIQMPEMVKRGFKPRPSAGEIQKTIQDKVREKMGLPKSTAGTDGSG
ncbi:hypothetical protein BU25DRAFT_155768 [Macroventuria anomochaeta]|uniref:Uncharacterized protein n=1 Tax=Macroventuria anomochaeta TaxID=301207 RepID=A0ACB6RT61_9PLEO|nr:uncharacterized protein BU25DRAFT_155768 [Macroventuria anomochaeta]KAF2624580.1 hypothetical protein BU25DRAFT_155768 [Macroventuria anomochaeta]